MATFGFTAEDKAQVARIQKGMNEYAKAIKARDFAAAARVSDRNFAPNCVFLMGPRKLTYAQWKEQVRSNFKMLKSVQEAKLTCNGFSVTGDSAMSMQRFQMKAKITGSKGKLSNLVVSSIDRLDYKKIKGQWMAVKDTTVKSTTTIDGRPVGM